MAEGRKPAEPPLCWEMSKVTVPPVDPAKATALSSVNMTGDPFICADNQLVLAESPPFHVPVPPEGLTP